MNIPDADTPLHHLYASPATGLGGRSFELGGWRWRPDGAGKVDPRSLSYRMAFAWNVCEGIPIEALEAGVIRDFYGAALDLMEAVERGAPAEELKPLAAEVRRLDAAHHLDHPDHTHE